MIFGGVPAIIAGRSASIITGEIVKTKTNSVEKNAETSTTFGNIDSTAISTSLL
jgi:hypothetical protein